MWVACGYEEREGILIWRGTRTDCKEAVRYFYTALAYGVGKDMASRIARRLVDTRAAGPSRK